MKPGQEEAKNFIKEWNKLIESLGGKVNEEGTIMMHGHGSKDGITAKVIYEFLGKWNE